ncbi:YceI family protein [Pedobacter glucosidilyticus]|uniref:YceI family protein n=1 Tax=Pedobacter glucosidilyticus TaxID=1122941 RepID=UPI0003F9FDD1|nr:YceI family protein [Pedobacter glucosidilyticus]
MKLLKLFIFTVWLLITAFEEKELASKWVIYKTCSLKVNGSTNVNKFNCVINNYYKPDTLSFVQNSQQDPVKMMGAMKLDINSFDCHNAMMTADLRKTLKAKQFPNLVIKFINLSKYPQLKGQHITGWVQIDLAGVSKKFQVAYQLIPSGTNTLQLKGLKQIKFSDFNIEPPRKIGGMITTEDELDIEFNLHIKTINAL